jgi:UDP-N-acetylmuramoyl-tripeptide--D-alanyl-D-alanine ligase
MKRLVIKLLAFFSRKIIKKYQPKVIGISGSIGKTGVKEYIEFILKNKFRVRASIKNYNNEFGLPLSIIGIISPGKNIWGWFKVFGRALKLLIIKDKNYPEVLILEMGIDRIGDMDYLLSIVKPDIGILTNISHSHIEYFGTLEQIKKEKSKLLKNLNKNGIAILNSDNSHLKELIPELKSITCSYGLNEGADFRAKDISFILPENLLQADFYGINFKLEHEGSIVPINLARAVSYSSIYSSLASLAVGFYLGLNIIEMAEYLNDIIPIIGRMNILPGIKNSIIIDDTYNASPESTLNALKTMEVIPKTMGRKIVILGDMLELGDYSDEGHCIVGKKIAEMKIDALFLIGSLAEKIGQTAIKSGFDKNNVFNFSKTEDALEFIKNGILSNDLIMVKASQGMRLEKIVKTIMLEPQKADKLLVRQGVEWQN